jgi:DNA-binding GntR family transcriptional regulator
MPTTALAVPRPLPRSDAAAAQLRADIVGEVLAPGDRLAEAAVAKRLGVSRVPVREALVVLEREGLVRFSPTGRAYVRGLTRQDFDELYTMRLALEPLAARLAAPHLCADPAPLLANVAATARATTIAEITRLDLEFHEAILAAAGNARLLRAWRALRWELGMWLGRLHRLHERRTRQVRAETVRAHTEIIRLFATRSPAACEEHLRAHVQSWEEWIPRATAADPVDARTAASVGEA